MANIYTKGWFVKQLKEHGVRDIDGRKLESFKTHVLRNKYFEVVQSA